MPYWDSYITRRCRLACGHDDMRQGTVYYFQAIGRSVPSEVSWILIYFAAVHSPAGSMPWNCWRRIPLPSPIQESAA